SHILSDMDEYCTHIGIMGRGAMVQFGTVHEVGHSAAEGRCRYTLTLAASVGGLCEILERIVDVTAVRVERDRASFEYPSHREAAAKLLVELIERRIPVASFGPDAPGLEEAYLRAGMGQVD